MSSGLAEVAWLPLLAGCAERGIGIRVSAGRAWMAAIRATARLREGSAEYPGRDIMDISFLKPLYDSRGPWCSVYLSTARDQNFAEREIELR